MPNDMVLIYIMGKLYHVPATLTIMKAMEYAGYKFIRGCGCRGGVCGACATVYRLSDSYKIQPGLACQTVVEPNMSLTQIPFFPANKAIYCIEELKPGPQTILSLYPEIARCVCCNSCTKICPQDLEVMDYVQAALRGDIEKAAKLSFECIMCGLCATRCQGEIVQYHVGLLARRLYAKYVAPRAQHLAARVQEIEQGKFDRDLEELRGMEKASLKKLYGERVIEEQ
jgi:formate hydrogenlyase subunit 6/NADH:ubiquinone oxidoreductase subunit I